MSSSCYKTSVSELVNDDGPSPPPQFTNLIEKRVTNNEKMDLLTDDDEFCDAEITNITTTQTHAPPSPEPTGDLRDGVIIHVDDIGTIEFEEFQVEEAIVSTKSVKTSSMMTKTFSSSTESHVSEHVKSENVSNHTTAATDVQNQPEESNTIIQPPPAAAPESEGQAKKPKTKKSGTNKKQKPEVSKENISVTLHPPEITNNNSPIPEISKKLGPGESRVFAKVCVANLRRSFGDLTAIDSNTTNVPKRFNGRVGPSSLPCFTNNRIKLFDESYWDRMLSNEHEKSSFSKFDNLTKNSEQKSEKVTSTEDRDESEVVVVSKPEPKKLYCASCEKQVFQMELIRAEKLDWHKNCFRCGVCRKVLSVDTYESNNKKLYCKPHFKELFQPKVVAEEAPTVPVRSKLQLIICESNPVELPPDVVRASDTPSTGLEDIQIDVKSKFEMFEGMKESETTKTPEPLVVKRSASVLAKLKKYENSLANGNSELEGVSDEDIHGVDGIELQSDEDEVDEGASNSVIKDEIKRKLKNPLQALNEIAHFKQMEQVRSKWEEGSFTKEEQRADQRKEELQKFRSRLCQGKSGVLKEMYEKGIDDRTGTEESESRKSEIEVLKSERARIFREMFEKGEIIRRSIDDDDDDNEEQHNGASSQDNITRRGVDLEVFEAGVAKESKKLFEELDKKIINEKTSEKPSSSSHKTNKFTSGKQVYGIPQPPETPTDVVRSCEVVSEPIQVNTAELSNKFKFFETYQETLEQKAKAPKREVFKRITPPREDGVVKTDEDYEEESAYRDPNIVRCGESPQDDTLQKSKTTSKMLCMFRQMESNVSNGNGKTPMIRPLKQFTPPRDTGPSAQNASDDDEYDNEEPVDDEEEEEPEGATQASEDEFLKEVGSLARARSLRAKFERWEQQENERNVREAPVNDELAESIESAKNLKAKFEAMKLMDNNKENGNDRVGGERGGVHAMKVNRFVLNNNNNSTSSAHSSNSVSPITVSYHSLPPESSIIMSGGSESCGICEKKVYVMEKIEAGGKMYHKNCFRCSQCKCILRMDTFTSNKGTLFCTTHFKQLFKIKGNYDEGFGHETQYQQWAKNKQAQAQQN